MTDAPARPARHRGPSHGHPRAAAEHPARAQAALAVTSVGVFVVFLDTTIVNVAFESIGRDLHATAQALAWALNAYSLVFAALLVPAGRIADQFGRRRMFVLALVGFAVTSAACGLAPSTGWLIAGRALQAVAAAMIVPTSLALLLAEFAPARRSAAVGTWAAMGAVAAAAGPTVGALLVQYASWRWIFLVNLPVCLIAAALVRPATREARDDHAHGVPDPLGVLLVVVFPGLAALAIIEAPTLGWIDLRTLGCLTGAALGLLGFRARTRRAAQPVVDLTLFRVRAYTTANVATLLFGLGFAAASLAGIVFLQTVWHWTVLRAALAVTPAALVAAAVSPLGGRLADRYGHRAVLMPGGVLYTAGMVWYLTQVTTAPHYLHAWLPATLVSGVGIGLTLPNLGSAAASTLSAQRLGVGAAVNNSFRQFGAVLGVSVFVALLGTPTTPAGALTAFRHTWLVVAAVTAAVVTLSAGIRTGPQTAGRPAGDP